MYEDIPNSYFNTKIFHLCPGDYEIPIRTVEKIRQKGSCKISADLGGFGGAHTSIEKRTNYKNKLKILKNYIHLIDLAKASLEDCYYLFENHVSSPESIIRKLFSYGLKIIIITLGDKGALIGYNKKMYKISSIKVKAIDCTGAGDTFTSAFLSEYLLTSDIERSGIFATAASSILIEGSGGVNANRFPNREDVLKRMAKYKNTFEN